MPKWNGGVIGVANNPTISSAKGIWSLSEATKAIRAGLWPPSNAGADPYFENVTLLLPGDGTNGAQNNTFLDSSTNNFTITRNGNTTQGTFTPFSKADGRWGVAFDDSGDQLTIASNAALGMGTGDFTIEFWYYHLSRSSGDTICAPSTDNLNIYINSSGVLGYYQGSSQNSSQTVPLNTWVHIALVRSGSTVKMYYNGTEVLSHSNSINYATASWYIGTNPGGVDPSHGVVSNLRIVKGTAVYTAAFTVPTAPLTAITNTVLLTCQSNRFIDNSTNAFAITRNGDVSVQTFSPFPTLTAYASGTNGGSGYFDGSGDYLSGTFSSTTVGSGDFTIELWYYPITFENYDTLFSNTRGSNGFNIGTNASKSVVWYSSSAEQINSGTLVLNAWNHIAFTRTSNTLRLYVNGTQTGATPTVSTNFSATTYWIGDLATAGGEPCNGYISGLRVVTQSLASGSTYTVPTAPPTAITNTSLLLNFTNGGIVDAAMSNDLETVGGAQISTTQSKFGGSSMYFDGTGDYLIAPNSQNVAFGTGDFTVEAWVYLSASKAQVIMDTRLVNSNTTAIALAIDSSNYPYVYVNNSTLFTSSTAISLSTWTHIAMVKSSGTITLYINGTKPSTGSAASSTSLTDTALTIGSAIDYRDTSATLHFNGYIDDLRITKGYARYTANFTAPTAAFNGFGE